MLSFIAAVFQFALQVGDPSWSCELTHRDPDLAGTYYFYCSQMTLDGVELIQVGRFISDAKVAKAAL